MAELLRYWESLSPELQSILVFIIPLVAAMALVRLLRVVSRRARRHASANIVSLRSRRHANPVNRWRRAVERLRPVLPLVILIGAATAYFGYERFLAPDYELTVSPGALALEGRVSRVRDGDTIVVAGTPIRFARLDCAEMGTAAGSRARQHMVELVRGERLSCRLTGERSYDRMIGQCTLSDGRNLSRVMVQEGVCDWW